MLLGVTENSNGAALQPLMAVPASSGSCQESGGFLAPSPTSKLERPPVGGNHHRSASAGSRVRVPELPEKGKSEYECGPSQRQPSCGEPGSVAVRRPVSGEAAGPHRLHGGGGGAEFYGRSEPGGVVYGCRCVLCQRI